MDFFPTWKTTRVPTFLCKFVSAGAVTSVLPRPCGRPAQSTVSCDDTRAYLKTNKQVSVALILRNHMKASSHLAQPRIIWRNNCTSTVGGMKIAAYFCPMCLGIHENPHELSRALKLMKLKKVALFSTVLKYLYVATIISLQKLQYALPLLSIGTNLTQLR